MYRAKRQGKARCRVYDAQMRAEAVRSLSLATSLQKALDKDEFFLEYQPIVSLQTGRLCGCEALLRWRHPELGLVPPMDFIPIAEETGQIDQIGDWVLRLACRQNKRWQQAGCRPIYVSVNVSAVQLRTRAFDAQGR